ncbi:hypothetical protein [Methanocella sp. MCL-LM]
MPTKKEMQARDNKKSDDQLLELAVFGLAVGLTVGAIALYIKSQNEKNII